jgi:flagellar biosynthetic protein FlhB
MAALGVVVGLIQTRGALRFNQLSPKLSRLRPKVHGAIIFSPQSAWNTTKSIVRMTVLAIVGWIDISRTVHTLMSGSGLDVFSSAAIAANTALSFIRTIAEISLVIALYDYRRARKKVGDTLKMTRFEVRDEFKQQEGSPLVKSEIRRRFRRMSRMRMLQAVAKANTLVVNPTHVAVALQYETGLGAPRVVAKGADELAARLRLEAEIHGVPIVRDVPLARALYGACEVGQEIPRDLYEAVARLLTFLYSLRRTGRLRRIDGAAHAPLASFLPVDQARRLGLALGEADADETGDGGGDEPGGEDPTGAATLGAAAL